MWDLCLNLYQMQARDGKPSILFSAIRSLEGCGKSCTRCSRNGSLCTLSIAYSSLRVFIPSWMLTQLCSSQSCVDGKPSGTFADTDLFQYMRTLKVCMHSSTRKTKTHLLLSVLQMMRIFRLFKFARSANLFHKLKDLNITA
jgi:hypothetical protein